MIKSNILTISCIRIKWNKMREAVPSYLCSVARGFFNVPVEAEGVKNILESVSYFSVNKSDALRKTRRRTGAAVQLRILQLNGLSPELWCLLASPHRCWAPLGLLRYFLFPPPSKSLHLREPWSLRAAPGLLQHCVLCIIVLISTDNIPADPRFQSCRLKGQNFSPSSPRRLIPGFTSSALRKFNCNLGLDRILLLQKVGITWYLFRGLSGGLASREEGGKKQM